VQIVLAAVMTPAEDAVESDRPRTAAKPWPKAAPAPAARIVVPAAPAPTDILEPTDGPLRSATTPMGLTAPLDSSSDASAPRGNGPTDADGAGEPLPRMANRRRPAEEFDGRAVAEPDGATLGGIMQLEPNPESITNEQR